MAMVLEPIANAVRCTEASRETAGIVNIPDDLPVIDLEAILGAIADSEWQQPFVLVLDTSLFGTRFQIAEVLSRFRLPHNVHVVTWASLQKLHMEGLEQATGGVVTLHSADSDSHRQVLARLRRSRHVVGAETSLLQAIALDRLDWSWESIDRRCRAILGNAGLLARRIAEGADGIVCHPALAGHPDHQVWVRHGRLGIPFVLLWIGGERRERFLDALGRSLIAAGLPGITSRDSFGFSTLSQTEILFGTSAERLRLAPGHSDTPLIERMADIIVDVLAGLDEVRRPSSRSGDTCLRATAP